MSGIEPWIGIIVWAVVQGAFGKPNYISKAKPFSGNRARLSSEARGIRNRLYAAIDDLLRYTTAVSVADRRTMAGDFYDEHWTTLSMEPSSLFGKIWRVERQLDLPAKRDAALDAERKVFERLGLNSGPEPATTLSRDKLSGARLKAAGDRDSPKNEMDKYRTAVDDFCKEVYGAIDAWKVSDRMIRRRIQNMMHIYKVLRTSTRLVYYGLECANYDCRLELVDWIPESMTSGLYKPWDLPVSVLIISTSTLPNATTRSLYRSQFSEHRRPRNRGTEQLEDTTRTMGGPQWEQKIRWWQSRKAAKYNRDQAKKRTGKLKNLLSRRPQSDEPASASIEVAPAVNNVPANPLITVEPVQNEPPIVASNSINPDFLPADRPGAGAFASSLAPPSQAVSRASTATTVEQPKVTLKHRVTKRLQRKKMKGKEPMQNGSANPPALDAAQSQAIITPTVVAETCPPHVCQHVVQLAGRDPACLKDEVGCAVHKACLYRLTRFTAEERDDFHSHAEPYFLFNNFVPGPQAAATADSSTVNTNSTAAKIQDLKYKDFITDRRRRLRVPCQIAQALVYCRPMEEKSKTTTKDAHARSDWNWMPLRWSASQIRVHHSLKTDTEIEGLRPVLSRENPQPALLTFGERYSPELCDENHISQAQHDVRALGGFISDTWLTSAQKGRVKPANTGPKGQRATLWSEETWENLLDFWEDETSHFDLTIKTIVLTLGGIWNKARAKRDCLTDEEFFENYLEKVIIELASAIPAN